MAVNFLTLRSAVANDMAVQHLTYSTMVGHPTASHQTVQAIVVSSIMTMGHVGIGTTTALSGTALNVVGSTMISGNTSIVGAATGTALVINNNQTGVSDTFSLMMTNKQTPPSKLMFIQKAIGNGAYNSIVQGGDHILLSYDQNSGVAGANGIVIGGWNQTAGLRIGTTSSAFNGDLTANSGLTGSEVYANGWFRVNGGGGLYWQTYGRGIYSADSAGASYGNVSVYGTGINSWNGYDINGRYTFMANGDTVGVHDKNNSWVWYNVNGTMTINKALTCPSINIIPYGCIIMWYSSIASIPAGWVLCNGSNGTPDLRDRFIVGAGYSYSPGNTGGENTVTLTTAQIPSHVHRTYVWDMWRHADGTVPNYNGWGNYTKYLYGVYAREQNQSGAVEDWNGLYDAETSSTGSSGSHENRPPYYALCYIMRTN